MSRSLLNAKPCACCGRLIPRKTTKAPFCTVTCKREGTRKAVGKRQREGSTRGSA